MNHCDPVQKCQTISITTPEWDSDSEHEEAESIQRMSKAGKFVLGGAAVAVGAGATRAGVKHHKKKKIEEENESPDSFQELDSDLSRTRRSGKSRG